MAGSIQINLIAPASGAPGSNTGNQLTSTLGALLWSGFQSGSDRRGTPVPTSQFFM